MHTLIPPTRQTLTPSSDRTPVERAVLDGQDPEQFITVTFLPPEGGARLRYAWTTGGVALGNRIDALAVASGLDAADHFHIFDLHVRTTHRGRTKIDALPLRPVLADVEARVRCPQDRRDGLQRVLDHAAQDRGHTRRPDMPRWLGVGPDLLNRRGR